MTEKKLTQIENAEEILTQLGIREKRVRHHGDNARIEVNEKDFQVILEHRHSIWEKFKNLGFLFISMDIAGFKSGSLNSALKDREK